MEFLYKKNISADYGLTALHSNHLNPFKRKVETIPIPGGSSDLIYLEGGYENKPLEIKCILEPPKDILLEEQLNVVSNWLESTEYTTLQFETGVILNVFFLEIVNVERLNVSSCKLTLKFTQRKEG